MATKRNVQQRNSNNPSNKPARPSGSSQQRKRAAAKRQQRDKVVLSSLLLILALASLLLLYSYLRFSMSRASLNDGLLNLHTTGTNAQGAAAAWEGTASDQRKLPASLRIENIELGGLTVGQAKEKLRAAEQGRLEQFPPLILTGANENLKKTAYELGLRFDINTLLNNALANKNKSESLKLELSVDKNILQTAIQQIAQAVDQEAKDAQATGFDQDKLSFTFTKETRGLVLDQAALASKLSELFGQRKYSGEVELPLKITEAGRTVDELNKILAYVASASTPIQSASVGRNTNVKLAADRISGLVVKPGEVFSYNKTIGPMTLENGFVAAGIQDEAGNDSEGIGGGLCQPSTTLYQAAVRADLTITEHNFHSTPVGYCPIGTDAMVSEWSDLKFRNDTEFPIAIVAYFDGATLGFDIYGPPIKDGAVIDLFVEEEARTPNTAEPRYVQDDELPSNETSVKAKERDARRVKVYKTYTVNGQLRNSVLLYENTYPSAPAVIAVNRPSKSTFEEGRETVQSGYYLDENGQVQPSYVLVTYPDN